MEHDRYQSQELISFLKSIQTKKFSGALSIEAHINSQQKPRNRILVFRNGELTYGGYKLPTSLEFVEIAARQLQSQSMNVAINFAKQRVTNPNSVRELLECLIKVRFFKWDDLEKINIAQIAFILEQLFPYSGQVRYETDLDFDLSYGEQTRGLNSSLIISDMKRRLEEWKLLVPTIPSMEAIPRLGRTPLTMTADPTVRQHIEQWVDGVRSLIDIAEALNKDPLPIAKTYVSWTNMGLLTFETENTDDRPNNTQVSEVATDEPKLPIILCVDDSPVMQTTIKRALSSHYQVLIADNAVDALNIVYNQPISLMLLDVSMPDIDGLELCRTIRKLPKFKDLPIIMLTAKDGLIDKMKGQIAGSTQYLTKPFNNEQLLKVVGNHVVKGLGAR
jgi:CheY-like chemotaxis protein